MSSSIISTGSILTRTQHNSTKTVWSDWESNPLLHESSRQKLSVFNVPHPKKLVNGSLRTNALAHSSKPDNHFVPGGPSDRWRPKHLLGGKSFGYFLYFFYIHMCFPWLLPTLWDYRKPLYILSWAMNCMTNCSLHFKPSSVGSQIGI